MIHESWPQGVLADYFLTLHISWKGHVGSEFVSVVAGCYISELEMEMAIITFLLLQKKISVIRYAKSSNTPNKSSIIQLQDFCRHAKIFFALKNWISNAGTCIDIFFWSNLNFKDVH